MAGRTPDFTSRFEAYSLTGVRVTGRQLGHYSYATVQELEYMGLKCAGKNIHDVLLQQGDTSHLFRQFEEECQLLNQVRHPNIVQFLGAHFQPGSQAPILVTELLPTNLTSCIEQYGVFLKEISYSILHDVALGLCYLHSQTPPIIHGGLSSNNVLLASNMTAKISDLGVARILNLTPLHVRGTPGTPAYMPPEVMVANPKYDISVDEFSYGTLMIHVFSGQWPEPQVGPTRFEDGRLVPVTEAERREVFLRAIGNDHPLMDLILKCIDNNPRGRAHAGEIVERMSGMTLQFPAACNIRLDMLRHLQKQEEQLARDLSSKHQVIQASITWEECALLPADLSTGTTTVIDGKVYYGGVEGVGGDEEFIVYRYDPSEDDWTTLPPLPVRYFGLGQINGKLVAVGGMREEDSSKCKEVYTYEEQAESWMQTIPPMPTARHSPGTLSLHSALIVAGGSSFIGSYSDAVEIFKTDTSQWYKTDPLPTPCASISLTAVGNKCYALGGNQAHSASVRDLLQNTTAPNPTSSAWKRIADTPTTNPTPVALAGKLLAICGRETSRGEAYTVKVFMYSPPKSWIYISDLPAPQAGAAAAVLSPAEILVIGGSRRCKHCGDDYQLLDSVYKGTLQLQ